MKYGYFHGDKGIFTGKVINQYGATFYEIKLVEGHEAGKLKVVTRLYDK